MLVLGSSFILRYHISLLIFIVFAPSFSRNALANPAKSGNSDLIKEVNFKLTIWNGNAIDTIPLKKNDIENKKEVEKKNPDKYDVFNPPEQMPQFGSSQKDLLDYLSKSIKYPKKAKREGVQGTVVVQFVINERGKVVELNVIRSVRKDLDKETLRVIRKMPRWKPGLQDGKPVKVKYTMPIKFSLE